MSTLENRFCSSLYLAFLKWFCNSEQERIINRNRYLFFGALTLLSFPVIWRELGLRGERTEIGRRSPNLKLMAKNKVLPLVFAIGI